MWSTGKVLAIASTAAFINMGYNIDAPRMPLVNRRRDADSGDAAFSKIFGTRQRQRAPRNIDGSAYYANGTSASSLQIPDDGTPYCGSRAPMDKTTEIIEITARWDQRTNRAKPMDNVKLYNLSDNLTFAAPTNPNGAYIPWSVNGKH